MTIEELIETAATEYAKWYSDPDNGDEESASHEYVREIVPLLIEALAASQKQLEDARTEASILFGRPGEDITSLGADLLEVLAGNVGRR